MSRSPDPPRSDAYASNDPSAESAGSILTPEVEVSRQERPAGVWRRAPSVAAATSVRGTSPEAPRGPPQFRPTIAASDWLARARSQQTGRRLELQERSPRCSPFAARVAAAGLATTCPVRQGRRTPTRVCHAHDDARACSRASPTAGRCSRLDSDTARSPSTSPGDRLVGWMRERGVRSTLGSGSAVWQRPDSIRKGAAIGRIRQQEPDSTPVPPLAGCESQPIRPLSSPGTHQLRQRGLALP